MSDKVFRDPLYNYIAFDRKRDGWLIELINCREVQRLRRIHQLGVSNFTYPGADHTRFAHSLGVTHLMLLVLEHLEDVSDAEKIRKARQALLATALLHDVGHGPFSHLFEPCLDINHEQWSIAVILDENSRVHQILKEQDAYLPNVSSH
ncbi:MAG: HD domain-containing protein [Verrucomicrobiae bacterium]|nr:HD domain-containing protein [Verrucomicrobiae bacterium]